jgi:hypothetical protein
MKEFKDKVAVVTGVARGVDRGMLLDRILETPHLAHVVPRLPPELLHRVIQTCGLEDCGELVALATPRQLAAVFDLDLWRPAQPGLDEQFDADRFGLWLEVMMESGAAVAAQKLAETDVDLAIAGFAQHMLVFDPAAVSPSASMDGEEMSAVGATPRHARSAPRPSSSFPRAARSPRSINSWRRWRKHWVRGRAFVLELPEARAGPVNSVRTAL